MAKILTRLRIDEVSSVDRGAGEGVKIMLMKRSDPDEEPYWKRKFTSEQRTAAARSGAAMKDGSFPIEDKDDLKNAMRAIGRAKDPGKAREHIRERARQLGLTGDLSDSFKRDTMSNSKISKFFGSLFGGGEDNTAIIDKSVEGLAESVTSILGDDGLDDVAKGTALTNSFEQFTEHLKSTLTAGPAVIVKEDSEMDLKALAKALGLADTATEADVTAAFAKSMTLTTQAVASIKKLELENRILKADFTTDELAFYNKASLYDEEEDDSDPKLSDEDKAGKKRKKAFRLASHSERANTMKAAAPALPPEIQKILEANEALTKRVAQLEGSTSLVDLAKRATDNGLPETEAATLQKAYSGDKEAIDKLLGFTKAAVAQARAGGLFKEFGSSGGSGVSDDPTEKLNELAKAYRLTEAGKNLSHAQAFAKVYEDPANAELAKAERAKNRPVAA